MKIAITGVGSYIPETVETNSDFELHEFYNTDGTLIRQPNKIIIRKFQSITGIGERRYAKPHLNTSDLASFASERAIADADMDPETLDYIIVAHNFGDIKSGTVQGDTLPSLASRVKHALQIKNPNCVAYDLLFGCPGWVEGVIHAQAFIKAGMAKKCLVIGAETLSRVVDKHDRDAMIFSDGAGATIIEAVEEGGDILSHKTVSYTDDEAYYLYYGKSYNALPGDETRYIKMYGRKIYEFALNHVPNAMKACLDTANIEIDALDKIFIHQANEKMDEAIVERFYKLHDKPVPDGIMPMNIHKLGNSSVATVPTLLDMVRNNEIDGQQVKKGDVVMFASVGAGMNINAILYRYG
ncbi:MAG: ketoacyl-ACP synthase III [Flavobacteriaceae bacterium]|nr:ketoacyl-ACP synthase III [Flavobacteriaceae bacterium]